MRSCTKCIFQSRMGTWNLSTHPSSGQQVIKVAECLDTRWQSLETRYLFISPGGVTSESPRFGGGRVYHRKWRKLLVEGMAAEVEVLRGDRQAKGLRGGKGRSSEQSWGLQHAGVCALWEQMWLFLLTGCLRGRLGWKKKKDRSAVA